MCHEHKVRDPTQDLGLGLGREQWCRTVTVMSREHSGVGLSVMSREHSGVGLSVMSREHSGTGLSRSCHMNTAVPDCYGHVT